MSKDDEVEILELAVSSSAQPNEREIRAMARHLGMDPDEDADLLHIAREALIAPTPPEWTIYVSTQDPSNIFYFNPDTGETSFEHPLHEAFKARVREALKAKGRPLVEPDQQITPSEEEEEEEEEEAHEESIHEKPKESTTSWKLVLGCTLSFCVGLFVGTRLRRNKI